jgi:hypothetical protein
MVIVGFREFSVHLLKHLSAFERRLSLMGYSVTGHLFGIPVFDVHHDVEAENPVDLKGNAWNVGVMCTERRSGVPGLHADRISFSDQGKECRAGEYISASRKLR